MSEQKYKVRIENIELKNFKSISSGSVYFDEFKKLKRKDFNILDFSNVLGIYGQNASGKTSIIEALIFIRALISGNPLPHLISNYIKKGEDSAKLKISFLLYNNEKSFLVEYSITIKKDKSIICISDENLSYIDDKKKEKRQFNYTKNRSLSKSFLSLLSKSDKKPILYFIANTQTSINLNNISPTSAMLSVFFNVQTQKLLANEANASEFNEITSALYNFCRSKFLIISTPMFERIDTRNVVLSGYTFENNQDKSHINCLVFFGKQQLEKEQFEQFNELLGQCSKVLNAFIPGLTIKPHIYSEATIPNGKTYVEYEVMSIRDGKEIPLIFESKGVKQMLTYVGDLIEVFNEEGTFIAIDEIDSGIFEYLLGELIYSFDNFSAGQLLFTSHNFRILEKIKPSEIFFTTTDDSNKFVKSKYVKCNNNLRDVYYKLIVQGDAKNKFYDATPSENITQVFSSLGKLKL
jgi:AAA15 family ATPase/GTPase